MKQLNFLSSLGSQSMGHRVTTLASTVGSPSAHRRGTMLKLISVLVLILTIGVGNAWGYTITFSGSNSESTTISTSTTAASITGSSSYVTGNVATASAVYGATSDGIKLGAKSSAGTIRINLSSSGQVTPTSIVVNCKLYNSSKAATLKVNGSSTQNVPTSAFDNVTFNITSAITYIQLESSKYIWVKSVTVNYSSGTKYTVNYDANGGSVSPSSHTQTTAGAAITTPTPTKAGYSCTGWWTSTSGGTKRCDAGSSYTPTATETVHAQWACIEPTINTQPASANYAVGATPAALSVSATLSSGTLTYLWKVSTNGGSTWSNASGTNNQATYAAANISTASAGTTKYKCIVTNSSGSCSTESNVATITVYATHKVYFYNGSTLLNTGGTDIAEGATVAYSGSEPVSCDEGEGASDTFVGWATGTWDDKKAAKGNIPGGITFYDITASQSLPNMSTSDVTYHAVFAKASSGATTWTKVTNSISAGDVIVIVNEAASKELTSIGDISGTSCGKTSAYSTTPAGTFPLTVETGNGGTGFSFKNGSNYLSWSSGNSLTTSTTKNNASSWTVNNPSSGNYTFSNKGDNTRKLQYNSGSPRFCCYTSSQQAFQIYRQNSSITYSNYMTTCCTPLASINGSFFRYHFWGPFGDILDQPNSLTENR